MAAIFGVWDDDRFVFATLVFVDDFTTIEFREVVLSLDFLPDEPLDRALDEIT